MSIGTYKMNLPLSEHEIFSLNGIYLMQFFNALIRYQDDEELFYAITDINNYTNLQKLHILLDSLILKKFKTKDIDAKVAVTALRNLAAENDKLSVEDIENILQDLFLKKHEPQLKVRKSISFFNSFEVLTKIFELIGEDYYEMIYEPTMEACVKIYQLYEWTYLKEFRKKEELEKDQIVYSGLLRLYNGFERFIAADIGNIGQDGFDYNEFYKKWTKRIESLLSQTDEYDIGITIKPLSQMIYNSLFAEGEDYIGVTKRSRGGKSSSNEALFLTQLYDYLAILKSERKVPIMSAPFVDVSEEEPYIYDSTRDDWVNSLRTDFVKIHNTLNTIRGLKTSVKEFKSSESIRSMVMRYKKDKSSENA